MSSSRARPNTTALFALRVGSRPNLLKRNRKLDKLPRMPSTPDDLAYCVPCPLNAGKLAQVVDFVDHSIEIAWPLLWQGNSCFRQRSPGRDPPTFGGRSLPGSCATEASPARPGGGLPGRPPTHVESDLRSRSTPCAWPQGRSKVGKPVFPEGHASPGIGSPHPTIGVGSCVVQFNGYPHATLTVPNLAEPPLESHEKAPVTGLLDCETG